MNGRRPAVILGGQETALPVARSLGRAGIPVHAVGHRDDPIRHSRYCTTFADLGSRGRVQERLLDWLLTGPHTGVLMPCSDHGLEVVSHNRAAIVERGHLPFEADDDVVRAMLDKERTYAIADQVSVARPTSFTVRDPSQLRAALDAAVFPCGLKPLIRHVFAERSGIDEKVIVVDGVSELERFLRIGLEVDCPLMVTEIIQGGDDQLVGYFSYLDEDGRPLFQFTNRKLRQNPIHFGVGCYVIGEWDPEVAGLGLRFLQGAGVRGVAHVEFKRDAREGRLKLIECNHRFNLAIGLLTASGLDVPLLLYNRLVGRAGPELGRGRTGLRLWHPLHDVRALRAYRRAGELTTVEWLRSLMHPQHFTVFSRDDPKPSAVVHGKWLVRQVRKRARQVLARVKPSPSAGANGLEQSRSPTPRSRAQTGRRFALRPRARR